MKFFKTKLTVLLLFTILFTGCDLISNFSPKKPEKSEKVEFCLTINLPAENSRNAIPTLPEASAITFSIEATKEGADPVTKYPASAGQKHILALEPGTWTITVTGNADGKEILKGEKNFEVAANGKYDETIEVNYITGTNSGAIGLTMYVDPVITKVKIDYQVYENPPTFATIIVESTVEVDDEGHNTGRNKIVMEGDVPLYVNGELWNSNSLSNFESANHNMILKFYGTDTTGAEQLIVAIPETIVVRGGLTTNKWVNGLESYVEGQSTPSDSYIKDGQFYLTSEIIDDLINHTFYVKGTGGNLSGTASDSNTGTWAAPLASVQEAVDRINVLVGSNTNDDVYTIFVDGHVYNQNKIDISITNANILICGFNASNLVNKKDILDGKKSAENNNKCQVLSITQIKEIKITNLVIQNGNPGIEGPGGGIYYEASGGTLTLDSVIIQSNECSNESGAGLFVDQSNGIYISNCIFSDNTITNTGTSQNYGSAITIAQNQDESSDTVNIEIKNTKIENNKVEYKNITDSNKYFPCSAVSFTGYKQKIDIENTVVKNNKGIITTGGTNDYFCSGIFVQKNSNSDVKNINLIGNVYIYGNTISIDSGSEKQENLCLFANGTFVTGEISSVNLYKNADDSDSPKIGVSLYNKDASGNLTSVLSDSKSKQYFIYDQSSAPTEAEISYFVSDQGYRIGTNNEGSNRNKVFIWLSKGTISPKLSKNIKFVPSRNTFGLNETTEITIKMQEKNSNTYSDINSDNFEWKEIKLLCHGDEITTSATTFSFEDGKITLKPELKEDKYVIFISSTYEEVTYSDSISIKPDSVSYYTTDELKKGTASNHIQVSCRNESDLLFMSTFFSDPNNKYVDIKLKSDITLSNNWQPFENFNNSIFDGENHTISNIKTAPFEKASNSTIKNLIVEGTSGNSGILEAGDTVQILNCINKAEIIVTQSNSNDDAYIGSIACKLTNQSYIENCINYGSISTTLTTCGSGGIGGIYSGYGSSIYILNCANYGNIKGIEITGGIAGKQNCTIENCVNLGYIKGTDYVGGISGQINIVGGNIYNCINLGQLETTAEGSIGQICGSTGTTYDIQYTYYHSNILKNGATIGPFGNNASSSDCYEILTKAAGGGGTISTLKLKEVIPITIDTETVSTGIVLDLLNAYVESKNPTETTEHKLLNWKYEERANLSSVSLRNNIIVRGFTILNY